MREPKDITINNKTLDAILEEHKHWYNENCDGWEDMRADLRDAYLRGADLRGANLCGADLCGADLRGADLRDAYLCGADLRDAYLRGANLCGADLRSADLYGAYLYDAYLYDAKGVYISLACPSHGSFIAWKKCRSHEQENKEVIVKLEIPEDAMRSSATGVKCRASKAKVLDIQDLEGNSIDSKAFSTYGNQQDFEYITGEIVEPREPFCEDRYEECASGIHFFVDRDEAVRY